MTAEEIMHTHRSLDQETLTIEIGTPGKGGALKIKGDADDPGQMRLRIENAFRLRTYAQGLMDGEIQPPSPDKTTPPPRPVKGDTKRDQKRSPVNGMPSDHLINDDVQKDKKATEAEPEPAAVAVGEEVCEECGGRVPAAQVKVSRMFHNRVLCKDCMPVTGGSQ